MPFNFRKFQSFPKENHSESGQGLLEFILIVTLSVGALIVVGATIMTPIATWYKSYFGSYLECLIDAAELPSLSPRKNSNENSVCEDQFLPFTLNGGRPFTSGEGAGGSGNGSGGSGSGAGSGNGSGGSGGNANQKGSNSQSGNQGKSNGSDTTDGSSGSGESVKRGVVVGPRLGDPAGFAKKGEVDSKSRELNDKKSELQSSKTNKAKSFKISNTNINVLGSNSVQYLEAEGISGAINQVKARKRNREENTRVISSIKRTSEEGGGSGGPTTRLIDKPQSSKVLSRGEIENPPMGLAGWLKWVIIIVLLVAIGLFVFGQVSQITKSLEK